jgi:hypothetical protein
MMGIDSSFGRLASRHLARVSIPLKHLASPVFVDWVIKITIHQDYALLILVTEITLFALIDISLNRVDTLSLAMSLHIFSVANLQA